MGQRASSCFGTGGGWAWFGWLTRGSSRTDTANVCSARMRLVFLRHAANVPGAQPACHQGGASRSAGDRGDRQSLCFGNSASSGSSPPTALRPTKSYGMGADWGRDARGFGKCYPLRRLDALGWNVSQRTQPERQLPEPAPRLRSGGGPLRHVRARYGAANRSSAAVDILLRQLPAQDRHATHPLTSLRLSVPLGCVTRRHRSSRGKNVASWFARVSNQ